MRAQALGDVSEQAASRDRQTGSVARGIPAAPAPSRWRRTCRSLDAASARRIPRQDLRAIWRSRRSDDATLTMAVVTRPSTRLRPAMASRARCGALNGDDLNQIVRRQHIRCASTSAARPISRPSPKPARRRAARSGSRIRFADKASRTRTLGVVGQKCGKFPRPAALQTAKTRRCR